VTTLLDRLHSYGTDDAEAAALEIERCHRRLEIDHVYANRKGGKPERQEVPYDERSRQYDGIECRDQTIKIQDENLETLRTKVRDLEGEIAFLKSED
jgi:hypothetical protein